MAITVKSVCVCVELRNVTRISNFRVFLRNFSYWFKLASQIWFVVYLLTVLFLATWAL